MKIQQKTPITEQSKITKTNHLEDSTENWCVDGLINFEELFQNLLSYIATA